VSKLVEKPLGSWELNPFIGLPEPSVQSHGADPESASADKLEAFFLGGVVGFLGGLFVGGEFVMPNKLSSQPLQALNA
jgi:hypothetical protein